MDWVRRNETQGEEKKIDNEERPRHLSSLGESPEIRWMPKSSLSKYFARILLLNQWAISTAYFVSVKECLIPIGRILLLINIYIVGVAY